MIILQALQHIPACIYLWSYYTLCIHAAILTFIYQISVFPTRCLLFILLNSTDSRQTNTGGGYIRTHLSVQAVTHRSLTAGSAYHSQFSPYGTWFSPSTPTFAFYEGWNFNFGNTPLDWIQELLEWRANAAGRMGPSPTYIMGAVHHETGIRSSQLIVSRCRDSV